MKRAAFYVSVSTVDQNPQTQLRDLREYAQRRGLSVALENEYVDHDSAGRRHAAPRPTACWWMPEDDISMC